MKPNLRAVQAVRAQLERGETPTPDLAHWRRLGPEAQRAQAELIHAFRSRSISVAVPDWRQGRLPMSVQVRLAQLAYLASPESVRDQALTPLLFNALLGLSAHEIQDIAAVLHSLLAFEHADLARKAFDLVNAWCDQHDPAELLGLYEVLLPTAAGADACVRFHHLGGAIPLGLCNTDSPLARSAIRAVGEQGNTSYLGRLLDTVDTPIANQEVAIQVLGETGTRAQLSAVLGHGLSNVEHLAEATVQFLCTFRERGFFLQDTHIAAVFELALHTTLPLLGLTAHLRDARRDYLLSVAPEDPRLLRWLPQLDAADSGLTTVWIGLLGSHRTSVQAEALRH